MMKNRLITLILALLMVLTLCSCSGKEEAPSFDIAEMAKWLTDTIPQPAFGSIGGEWVVTGLARAGAQVPEGYYDGYYALVEKAVTDCGGVLSEKKYTEYSRTVIALTAIGKDPTNVAGFDILAPLGFYEQTIFQGVNGAAYALLALDCGSYEMPVYEGEGTQATREMYVDYILSQELPGGGWSFAGGSVEADMTGMVLQALARYTDRQDVSDAVGRGLEVLSELQQDNGGFASDDKESCEAIAQVITALCELGISIDDKRFVKDGRSLLNRLADFSLEGGGFVHALDEEKANYMASEQAFYALAALERLNQGKTSLYDMSDVQ